jgi:hypothetical protein
MLRVKNVAPTDPRRLTPRCPRRRYKKHFRDTLDDHEMAERPGSVRSYPWRQCPVALP